MPTAKLGEIYMDGAVASLGDRVVDYPPEVVMAGLRLLAAIDHGDVTIHLTSGVVCLQLAGSTLAMLSEQVPGGSVRAVVAGQEFTITRAMLDRSIVDRARQALEDQAPAPLPDESNGAPDHVCIGRVLEPFEAIDAPIALAVPTLVNNELVDFLERTLAKAKSGELQAAIIIGEVTGREIIEAFSGDFDVFRMLGALTLVEHRILKSRVEE